MKIRKSITEKVIAANQHNSHKSPGPGNMDAVKENARKHGVLAKHLKFESAEEEAEFDALRDEFTAEYQSSGATERALVDETCVCLWRLGLLDGWATQELANRRGAARAIVKAVAENYTDQQLALFTQGDGSRSAAGLGWDCQELIIRTGSSSGEQEDAQSISDTKTKSGHVLIEAKLNSSIDTIARYQTSVKRDFYRAIAMLREIQRERRESKSFNGSAVLDK
jgi:hypothetical protein